MSDIHFNSFVVVLALLGTSSYVLQAFDILIIQNIYWALLIYLLPIDIGAWQTYLCIITYKHCNSKSWNFIYFMRYFNGFAIICI